LNRQSQSRTLSLIRTRNRVTLTVGIATTMRTLAFFLILSMGGGGGGVHATFGAEIGRADTTKVLVRRPSSETLAQYRTDSDYSYETASSGTSWWDQLWAWIFEQLDRTVRVPWAEEILYALAVLVTAGLLLFAARWLFRMRRTAPVERRPSLSADAPVTRETLETADFVEQAKAAEADGAYRRAVRFYYLDLLQRLMQADLVGWTPDKANRELVRETRGTAVHDAFDRATEIFEVVWYGNVSLDRSTYDRIREEVAQARDRVPTTEPQLAP
jgi:hypothetical protein